MLPVQFDDVNGKRLRYFRGGKGPTIVFLHGYPDNLQMWSGVIPPLSDFEAIAFDWPGMGGSEAWVGGATPFAMADRLIADATDESEKSKATRALAHLYKLLQSHYATGGRGL